MSDLKFIVEGESNSPTKFLAKARHFKLIVDEPKELGGTDDCANPVEYILAGLAGCVNVIAHMVAKELKFELQKLKIVVTGDINPDRFLGNSDKERAGFKSVILNLFPESNADAVTLRRWLNTVKNRCPVKDNLNNKTPVKLKLDKDYC